MTEAVVADPGTEILDELQNLAYNSIQVISWMVHILVVTEFLMITDMQYAWNPNIFPIHQITVIFHPPF